MTRFWAALLLATALVVVVDRLYVRESGELTAQAAINVHFAERASGSIALAHYPKQRPPLYALLLRAWVDVGLPPLRLNEALGLVTLLLLWACGRRLGLPDASCVAVVVLWACAHFVYVNLHQPEAESLVVPLSLGLLLSLSRYVERPSHGWLALCTALTALLLASRYFSLFAVLPVTALTVLATPAPGRPLVRAAVATTLATAPLGAWMGWAYVATGYWTGAPRHVARHFPAAVAGWGALTTFPQNLRLLLKTVVIDFFSPSTAAALAVVTQPHEWTRLEILLVALATACLAILVRRRLRPASPTALLCGALLAVYLVALVAVWTVGNNDPLHTRFLFPCYPFLVLGAFGAHAALCRSDVAAGPWMRLPFGLLYAVTLSVQLSRSWLAVPLPVRYETDVEGAAEGQAPPLAPPVTRPAPHHHRRRELSPSATPRSPI